MLNFFRAPNAVTQSAIARLDVFVAVNVGTEQKRFKILGQQ
jgi:hypothetical protein